MGNVEQELLSGSRGHRTKPFFYCFSPPECFKPEVLTDLNEEVVLHPGIKKVLSL